jgi:predicted nucleotidyltransferase
MIVDAFDPKRIIFFGSRAEGRGRPDSDVDLLVEMEAFADEPCWKRRIRVDQLFGV